ncbi:cell envelope biogenesis protein TolA [Sphingomonas sp.]|uniref:cell envelope biogenesis protein TolA n=1 Tax=Sphingomonas sp. TaxID=28214 RepID=UPI001B0409C4|nr:cell envelope biogenesis protein TolA [Sphingomonas sp.]MBO9713089.1 cell envelope biogenesis protein TolA [Sphingomonas sp.]
MDRADGEGLVISILLHGGLIAGVWWLSRQAPPPPPKPMNAPIEVSLADDVGLVSAAPEASTEPPATQVAPEAGPVEPDAAEQPADTPEPPVKKPDQPKPMPDPVAPPAKPKPPTTASGGKPGTRSVAPTGRLGDDLIKGLTDQPSPGKSTKPQATMTGEARQNIGSAIARQVQPCVDRQVSPGPGSERIRAIVTLNLNPDGSLAGPVRIVDHDGVDDDNERYIRRVDDAVRAVFAGCSPLRNLPPELYDVPNGWRSFTLRLRINPR